MGMHIKATPVRMLGVAIFAALSMTVIGLGAPVATAVDGGATHITVNKDRNLLDGDYVLDTNIDGQIVIAAGQSVTLDLNGHNVTSTNEDAIVVNDGATLVINGNGTVEAVGSGVAPLYNHRGTVTLNGGKFLKDENKGGYYSVLNQGAMTINDATIWMDNTKSSSLLANGAIRNYDDSTESGAITINGGQFYGGVVNLKNDEGGTATINGGHFIGGEVGTIQNWNKLTINDGAFDTLDGYNGAVVSVSSGEYSHPAAGITEINGGTFTGNYLLEGYQFGGKCTEEITVPVNITGGTFNVRQVVNPNPLVNCGDAINESVITGGLFTNDDIELPALPDGYYAYILGDGSKLVTDQKVDFESGKFVLNLTMGGDNGVLGLDGFVLQNAAISIDRLDDGDIEMNGAEIIATHPGTVVVTVEFNGEVQTYVINIAAADETVDDSEDLTPPVDEAIDSDSNVTAPNTGSAVSSTVTANDSVSTLATITTAIVMLMMLAGLRVVSTKE